MVNPISAICEKVQDRLQDPENYKKFLDCVRSYESKFVNTPQFRMLVSLFDNYINPFVYAYICLFLCDILKVS